LKRTAEAASETGGDFLAALVRSLAGALQVDGAWVTEYLPGAKRLRALSFWFRDHYVPDYEYDIATKPPHAHTGSITRTTTRNAEAPSTDSDTMRTNSSR